MTVVTNDAMGCQRAITAQIEAQPSGLCIGVKGNQGTLHEAVALLFDEQQGDLCRSPGDECIIVRRRTTGAGDTSCGSD